MCGLRAAFRLLFDAMPPPPPPTLRPTTKTAATAAERLRARSISVPLPSSQSHSITVGELETALNRRGMTFFTELLGLVFQRMPTAVLTAIYSYAL